MKQIIKSSATLFEICLVLSLTFSFAYFIHEADSVINSSLPLPISERISLTAKLIASIGSFLFGSLSSVSALENQDIQQGLHTCLLSKDGKSCQEYIASECAAKCASSCVPSLRNDVSACKLGTCYDMREGTCQAGAPQNTCTSNGGQWFDDPYENVPQCREGCCVINGVTSFITEQQCTRKSTFLGAQKEFRADIRSEIQCIGLSSMQEEGACVFVKEYERTCKFTPKSQCLQLKGDFYSQLLCSNSALNTTCVPQQTTGCASASDGVQKVYWFDSCGNRENIYDYNRRNELKTFGKFIPANESCAVGARGNPVANANLCGNCNYLLGSSCGKSTDKEKAAIGDYVCRDLSCIDEQGKKRAHGESWCQYQSATGVDIVKNRGMDTPGSRHFRKVCVNGEVRTEPCADYRNEICVESQMSVNDGKLSSAACKINLAYQCFDYNGIVNDEKNRNLDSGALALKNKERNQKCEDNPDCFVKNVNVGKDFKFDYCVPKYKPGFASLERGDILCSQSNVQCTVVYVKGLGGWKCKGNCECEKEIFAEQMNDLCMSIGDCGGQVNYKGVYSDNYRTTSTKSKIPKVSQSYITELVKYAKPIKGKFIEAPDIEKFYSFLGIPEGLGDIGEPGDPATAFGGAGMISGMMGVALLYAAKTAVGSSLLYSAGLGLPTYTQAAASGYSGALGPGISAAGGALAGAAIGFAVTSLLLKYTGVGRGLPPALTYILLSAGVAAGAIIGASLAVSAGASSTGFLGGLAAFGPAGWIMIAVVVVIVLILKLFGIGKVKKITVSFTCNSWQAPAGKADACKQCGSDGLPCTPYSCESLGQSCQLINEDTESSECVSVAQNDTVPPVITFNREILRNGNYTVEQNELGVKIKSSISGDGCIQESFIAVPLSLTLDEPGQCAASNENDIAFDEMEDDFSSLAKNRFTRNHTRTHFIPSLESLGFEDFDPRAKAEQNIFVKCKDIAGNANMRDFAINYCVKQGPDLTPASVLSHDPALETVAFVTINTSINVYTNEPASCKWDIIDRDYELMSGGMNCRDDIDERTLRGWQCNGNVPIRDNETTYYIRCLDQPWLNESQQEKRNFNRESYSFKLKRSINALQIDSVTPNEQIISVGTEPASVSVVVKTSGGVDGTARCGFYWQNSSLIDFAQGLWTNVNKQTFQAIFSGVYELPITCVDMAGNTAESKSSFTVQIDNKAPEATRVFREDNNLVVITDEEAQCRVSTNSPVKGESGCAYEWINGTSMGVKGKSHSIPWKAGTTYYIKCKDKFDRSPGTSCTIQIKGTVEPTNA